MLLSTQPLSASNHDQKEQQSYCTLATNGLKKGAQWTWDHKVEVACAAVILGAALYFGSQYMKTQNTGNAQAVRFNSDPLETLTYRHLKAQTQLNVIDATIKKFNPNELNKLLDNQNELKKIFLQAKLTCMIYNSLTADGLATSKDNLVKVIGPANEFLSSLSQKSLGKRLLNQEFTVWKNELKRLLDHIKSDK